MQQALQVGRVPLLLRIPLPWQVWCLVPVPLAQCQPCHSCKHHHLHKCAANHLLYCTGVAQQLAACAVPQQVGTLAECHAEACTGVQWPVLHAHDCSNQVLSFTMLFCGMHDLPPGMQVQSNLNANAASYSRDPASFSTSMPCFCLTRYHGCVCDQWR